MTEKNVFSISDNEVQPGGRYDIKTKCGEIMISFKSFKFDFICSLCYKGHKYTTFYDLYKHVTKEHNLYSEEVDRPVNVVEDIKNERMEDPLAEDVNKDDEIPSVPAEDIKFEFEEMKAEYIEEEEEEVEEEGEEEENEFEKLVEEDVEEYKIEYEDGLVITPMEELPAVARSSPNGKEFIPFGRIRPKNDTHCLSVECKEKEPSKRQDILKLIDMYRKCIGLWHTKTAERTPLLVKTTARRLMIMRSGIKLSTQNLHRSLARMTRCFNSTLKNNSGKYKPWFYEEMKFIQFADFDEIPDEAFYDFQCPFCKDEMHACGTLDLWKHIVDKHKLVCHIKKPDVDDVVMTWPTDHILEFISIYREHESLWNCKSKEYFNRPLKAESYQLMLNKFSAIRPNALTSREAVKDIIKQLRIYFHRADRKYQVSNLLDKIENPASDTEFLVYEKLLFLKDVLARPRVQFTESFKCDICKKSFSKKILLHDHHKSKHTNLGFKCDKCPLTFVLETSLRAHHSTQHQDDGKIYNCPICHLQYSNLDDFDMHLYDHLPHKSVAQQDCPICDITMNDRGNLLIHLRRHCDIKKFPCEVCNERFITSTELKLHKIKHSSDRPYVCEICGAVYKYRHHLVKHNRYHTGPTFECDECGMKLYTRKELIEHKKAHTYPDVPLGKFVCELCGSLFSETANLARHKLKVHQIKIRAVTDREKYNKLK